MNMNLSQHSVSVEALVPARGNLRMQVKPQSGGRSQNEELARGMAV